MDAQREELSYLYKPFPHNVIERIKEYQHKKQNSVINVIIIVS